MTNNIKGHPLIECPFFVSQNIYEKFFPLLIRILVGHQSRRAHQEVVVESPVVHDHSSADRAYLCALLFRQTN